MASGEVMVLRVMPALLNSYCWNDLNSFSVPEGPISMDGAITCEVVERWLVQSHLMTKCCKCSEIAQRYRQSSISCQAHIFLVVIGVVALVD